jgi:hypothetical protein
MTLCVVDNMVQNGRRHIPYNANCHTDGCKIPKNLEIFQIHKNSEFLVEIFFYIIFGKTWINYLANGQY